MNIKKELTFRSQAMQRNMSRAFSVSALDMVHIRGENLRHSHNWLFLLAHSFSENIKRDTNGSFDYTRITPFLE